MRNLPATKKMRLSFCWPLLALLVVTTCLAHATEVGGIAASAPGFTISGPATMATIPNTQVSTVQITVTPLNGFKGGVHLECGPDKSQSSYLQAPFCNFSLLLNTVTITSTAAQSAPLSLAPEGFALPMESGGGHADKLEGAVGGIFLVLLLPLLLRRRRALTVGIVMAAGMSFLSGCGGSPQRTPTGIYQYVITGYDTTSNTIHETGTVSIQVI